MAKNEDKLFIVTITSHKIIVHISCNITGMCVISNQISPQSSVIKKISWNTRKGELHWTLDRGLKHLHASGTEIWERNCTD